MEKAQIKYGEKSMSLIPWAKRKFNTVKKLEFNTVKKSANLIPWKMRELNTVEKARI